MASPFESMPDEIVSYILSLLPPYGDVAACMRVCRRWRDCAEDVLRRKDRELVAGVSALTVRWRTLPPDRSPITRRFSHAACVLGDGMYVFGGCTTNATAFNDLWRFSLSRRAWVRPPATGAYPTPKAYATLVAHGNRLVLFGGWAYSHDWLVSADVHCYDTKENRWTLQTTVGEPPPVAGHAAVLRRDAMIVFGGLCKPPAHPTHSSDDLWLLDLRTMTWRSQPTNSSRPPPRYGHSLLRLDDDRFLLLGGIKASKVYRDCWLLSALGPAWTWRELEVRNPQWAVADLWCNPACRVGDKVVALAHGRDGHALPARMPHPERLVAEDSVARRLDRNMRRLVDRDTNVNGRRGPLPRHVEPEPGPSAPRTRRRGAKIIRHVRDTHDFMLAAFVTEPTPPPPPSRPIERRPVALPAFPAPPVVKKPHRNTLSLHALDVAAVLAGDADAPVSWLRPADEDARGAPEEVIMYSLLEGRGELIMFGGLYCNVATHNCALSDQFSNSLHFITPPKDIV